MVCIHSPDLATVVTGFVCMLVVHVVRDTDFGEYQRMISHVSETFVSQELKLISQAVSDSCLSDFYAKNRGKVFSTKDTNHIDIVNSIPVQLAIHQVARVCEHTNASSRE